MDTGPLSPEIAVGGKSTKFNPPHFSAAHESTWYRGDPAKQRILAIKPIDEGGPQLPSNLAKDVLQGSFYSKRENGFSSIHDNAKVPNDSTDGSNVYPGVLAHLTRLQERAFFKSQVHDEYNRTYVARVLEGQFMYGGATTHPKLNTKNIITRNRRAASKPNSRSQSAVDKRAGLEYIASDLQSPQRRAAERITNEAADLLDCKAQRVVADFLSRETKENRESFEELFGSIRSSSKRARGFMSADHMQNLSLSTGYQDSDTPVRPGTAAVMERSNRDFQRAVSTQLQRDHPGMNPTHQRRVAAKGC